MIRVLSDLYGDETNVVTKDIKQAKNSDDIISKMPKMVELRKNLKAEVDKVPMLKYIIGSHGNNGRIREVTSKNPIKMTDDGYRGKAGWFNSLGGEAEIETFRQTLGSLI
jgi:hypothetical protein